MSSTRPPLSPIDAEQLSAWTREPWARTRYSALGEECCLLVDATRAPAAGERAAVGRWLQALAVPSIAVGAVEQPLAALCDVAVATLEEAAALQESIRRTPLAAGLLVQLLRLGEGLPLESALIAESLAYSTLQAGPEYRAWLQRHRADAPAVHTDSGPAVLMEREAARLDLALNRASNRNGMTVEMRDALVEALELVLADACIEQVQLRGLGTCFSTGGDLSEFGSAPDPATAHLVRSLALPGRLLAACAARVTVQVHGACVGSGIEFPAFAGRIVASSGAWFQLPELKFGLIPGAGGTVSIARRIGRQRLAGWVLSGQRIDARIALAWGLVDAIAG